MRCRQVQATRKTTTKKTKEKVQQTNMKCGALCKQVPESCNSQLGRMAARSLSQMWFDDAVARHDIAKQVIKLAKKGKISVQLVLSPRSNAIQELPKTAKQPKKRKLNFSSPAIGIRLVGCLYSEYSVWKMGTENDVEAQV